MKKMLLIMAALLLLQQPLKASTYIVNLSGTTEPGGVSLDGTFINEQVSDTHWGDFVAGIPHDNFVTYPDDLSLYCTIVETSDDVVFGQPPEWAVFISDGSDFHSDWRITTLNNPFPPETGWQNRIHHTEFAGTLTVSIVPEPSYLAIIGMAGVLLKIITSRR